MHWVFEISVTKGFNGLNGTPFIKSWEIYPSLKSVEDHTRFRKLTKFNVRINAQLTLLSHFHLALTTCKSGRRGTVPCVSSQSRSLPYLCFMAIYQSISLPILISFLFCSSLLVSLVQKASEVSCLQDRLPLVQSRDLNSLLCRDHK